MKFKVGDFIVYKRRPKQVHYIEKIDNNYYVIQSQIFEIEYIDRSYRKLTKLERALK